MDRRTFSKKEKQALYILAGGKCERCGNDLDDGWSWHADHVKPFSRDGKTDVANGQALCAECNLRKGNRE